MFTAKALLLPKPTCHTHIVYCDSAPKSNEGAARVHFTSGATGLAMGRTAVEQAVLGDLPALNSTQHRPFGWAQGRLLPGRCGLCQACP
jgi:non-ribosomal peptide synthetase component F